MTDFVQISCGDAIARVNLRGAELKSWVVGGDDLLWPGDPASWPDSAPLLFPVVGWTRDGIRVDGRRYPLGLHGFIRHQIFAVVAAAPDRVTLATSADAQTKTLFPFNFHMNIEYQITTNKLRQVLHVVNEGSRPMPYAVGLHPGFRWPLPGATRAHAVIFDSVEAAEVPVIAPGGLFSQEKRAVPLHGRRLDLTPNLFSEALCFLDANSRGLDFCSDEKVLRMTLDNFRHIALWSLPGAKFLCLEAWTGHGDPVGFDGDLSEKPSMRLLVPGEKARHAATFSWRAP
ncbi:aldose 1-epimerase family protein [Rhodoblastus acidophilus]|uniref:Aldose 1-epimerase family protein n=1 Tax=Rhodoblastus acidophilus TaxID=1074 RepID=A0A6N8DJZ5_RHOAC|nr:aldose 1-epimerase family protein [Rhodoblastus acidophilus]MCW2273975.1 galactose mutarotase-like enzyme [Rhodoblastus acidophilus]MTV30882.1 aldose 1-epimerase family protein [Rhodoblastus acidophilus]